MSKKLKKISIIVPCYNEEEAIPFFYEEIKKIQEKMKDNANFEILFVNDGSRDKTLDVLRELSSKNDVIDYISFSRNFGKEAAMYAGLKECSGDYVAIMDADLQDPPSLIPEMFRILEEEDYDSVGTRRVNRKGEKVIVSFFSRLFYKIMNYISDTKIVDGARDFRLMNRMMVDAILEIGEYNRFSKGIFGFVGFKTKWLEFENEPRVAGNTSWSFWKLLLYSFEGFTAFSTKPLILSTLMGLLFCFIAFIAILVIIFKTLVFGDPVSGWPSLVCIILFVSGVQLFCIGILGQYLAKTYLEVKDRPIYIVRERSKNKK